MAGLSFCLASACRLIEAQLRKGERLYDSFNLSFERIMSEARASPQYLICGREALAALERNHKKSALTPQFVRFTPPYPQIFLDLFMNVSERSEARPLRPISLRG